MENFVELGKKIYNLNNPREARRFVIFVARCLLHPNRISDLKNFFAQSELLTELANKFPFFYEQLTRAFFYYKSTFGERKQLIKDSLEFFTQTLQKDFLLQLYDGEKFELWKMFLNDNLGELKLFLAVISGQRKEGLATVILELSDGTPVYQINFWIAKDSLTGLKSSADDLALWIGAMQGPNVARTYQNYY